MQLTELSIIIPVRNIEQQISGILRSVAAQAAGLEVEFIVVDMAMRRNSFFAACWQQTLSLSRRSS